MFIVALFTIVRTWKQPKCPSTDEWIKKIRYISTMKHSALRKKEIISFVSTWRDLEVIMLSEVNHKEKYKYHMM